MWDSTIKAVLHALEALLVLVVVYIAITFIPFTPEVVGAITGVLASFLLKFIRDFTGRDFINMR